MRLLDIILLNIAELDGQALVMFNFRGPTTALCRWAGAPAGLPAESSGEAVATPGGLSWPHPHCRLT